MENRAELRLVLGDQLSLSHPWFQKKEPHVTFIIAELHQEACYVKHHGHKLLAFFAAMHDFALTLKQKGHQVCYLTLDETKPFKTLAALILHLVHQYKCQTFCYQYPDEYRLKKDLALLDTSLNIEIKVEESEHFLIPFKELKEHFKKINLSEWKLFIDDVGKKFNILMDGDSPEGGQWNFDQSNRKKLKKNELDLIPTPKRFRNDVTLIKKRVIEHKLTYIGSLEDTILWPINRAQALSLLQFFCKEALPFFGHFQDAMTCKAKTPLKDKNWSLFHSRLSFALNTKMLSPIEVVETAIKHYRSNPNIDCAQIEGFVRQIIGWREFIRGIYWVNMPEYKSKNALKAKRDLPSWFWTGETDMRCMAEAIQQSLTYAYAHHIQRLMVTGNFCLIAGIDPDQVDAWYLGIYIDAIEWVELPNTRGMSQFADGGIVASKAYASSGNYINKMSDYCSQCIYDVKEKITEKACPFNALYWHFLHEHQKSFKKNPRQAMIYKVWQNQPEPERKAILKKAKTLLNHIEQL